MMVTNISIFKGRFKGRTDMRKMLFAFSVAGMLLLSACGRQTAEETEAAEQTSEAEAVQETSGVLVIEDAGADKNRTISVRIVDSSNPALPGREAKQVRGIYITGPVAGNEEVLNGVLDGALAAGINAVVIDFKEDQGRITCPVNAATVNAIGASIPYVRDMSGLIESLKGRGLYVIARVSAFRDSFLAEKKPEWSLTLPDGSLYRDRQGMAWVDPYRQEVWDYLLEVGTEAKDLGFDEVQFDYLRFPNEADAGQVVYDDAVIRGRSKTDTILECANYLYENLASQGLFVSADVFGTIIGSGVDSEMVGQSYTEMAKIMDYICPMIYPSHYSSGNFGIEHPDMEPYKTIFAALQKSGKVLSDASRADNHESRQAIVRPWLQDFTATYLGEGNYITYGAAEVAEEVRAVQDAGYEEWMLWSAANKYHLDGLLAGDGSASEAVAEAGEASGEEAAEVSGESEAGSEGEAPAETESVQP